MSRSATVRIAKMRFGADSAYPGPVSRAVFPHPAFAQLRARAARGDLQTVKFTGAATGQVLGPRYECAQREPNPLGARWLGAYEPPSMQCFFLASARIDERRLAFPWLLRR